MTTGSPSDDDAPLEAESDSDAEPNAHDSSGQPAPTDLRVPDEAAGQRLDKFLSQTIGHVSRARITRSIEAGLVQLDGVVTKASHRVLPGQMVRWSLLPQAEGPVAEQIALDILYEDDVLAVVNKPAGMVVHPAKGHWAGTLASALQGHFDRLSGIGGVTRPGIVHRLDRDTTGVILVAKTDAAHEQLAAQFQARTVTKHYLALVLGRPDRDRDQIDEPIGPHASHREKMAIRRDHPESRSAQTFYEVLDRYRGFSLVRAEPKTGRTHQVRLHLAHAGYPVLCDRLYGGRSQITVGELRQVTRRPKLAPGCSAAEVVLGRQALHAQRICLRHPRTGDLLDVAAPLPADLERLKVLLQQADESE
jgi:23S rRNA pseudouridine1911/1915/1917 synthase